MNTTKGTSRFSTKTLAILGLTVFLLTSGASVAHALFYISSTKNMGAFGGRTYVNQSTLTDEVSNGEAVGWAIVSSGSSAPAGHVGAQGRLYFSNGVICKATSSIYNSSPALGFGTGTIGHCGIDTYYSMGRGAYWNGSNFVWYSANPTMHMNLP